MIELLTMIFLFTLVVYKCYRLGMRVTRGEALAGALFVSFLLGCFLVLWSSCHLMYGRGDYGEAIVVKTIGPGPIESYVNKPHRREIDVD